MTFDEKLADDFDNVFLNVDEFATAIIYRSKDDLETDIPLNVIFIDAYEQVNISENFIASSDPHIYFRLTALEVTPQIGDEIEIDEVIYTAANIREDSAGAVRIYLTEADPV
jgi:hypothetical protein